MNQLPVVVTAGMVAAGVVEAGVVEAGVVAGGVVAAGVGCTVKLNDPTDCPPTLQFSAHWPIWVESILPDSAQLPLESVVPMGVLL